MLTLKEKEIYYFIKSYLAQHSIAPTLREVGQAIGFVSRGATSKYVNQLVEKGFLHKKKSQGHSRNLFLTSKTLTYSNTTLGATVPLVGMIAAGSPIEAIAQAEQCDINDIIQGDNLFMLQVRGNSMIEEGIYDGDYVICEQAHCANNGDIVVALVDNQQATLKRFYQQGATVLLAPANSDMQAMEFAAHRVVIQGKLRHQLRSY